jgi:hypothetical protein
MNPTTKRIPSKAKSSAPFIRRNNNQSLPKSHNPDCPVLVGYNPKSLPLELPHLLASITEGAPGEFIPNRDRAALHVLTNGDALFFTSGILQAGHQDGSMLITKVAFPLITAKLREIELPHDWEPAEYRSLDNSMGRTNYFGHHGENDPCRALHLLRFWDQFEYRDLSWESRNRLMSRRFHPDDPLDGFKEECGRLGLEFGQRAGQKDQLSALDHCLGVLESAFWDEVRTMAASAIQTAKKHNKSQDTDLGRIEYPKPPDSAAVRLLKSLGVYDA